MNVAKKKTREDVSALIRFITKGKKEGKSLTELFAAYAKKTGKAKGSVRNRYYEIAAKGKADEEFGARFFKGETPFAVQKKHTFTPLEEERLLIRLFTAKKRGVSVRSALFSLAEGNPTLALRYQNKYRNLLVKNPSKVLAAAEKVRAETGYAFQPYGAKTGRAKNPAYQKTTARERALALKLARLKAENARLKSGRALPLTPAKEQSIAPALGAEKRVISPALNRAEDKAIPPAESKVKRVANALAPAIKTVGATSSRP